jgi:hypothetical protein
MLTVAQLIDEAGGSDVGMELVVKDFEGKTYHLVADNIMFDYTEGQIILELHSEIEEE